jgi:hypothetical protein
VTSYRVCIPLTLLLCLACGASAERAVETPPSQGDTEFERDLRELLEVLRESPQAELGRLIDRAENAPVEIVIVPITDDETTWHRSGKRSRSHTDPVDGRPTKLGRSEPTGARLYLNPEALRPGAKRYRNGTLVHELVHAVDLAYGQYNADYAVRERRAVFMQNLARELNGYKLRGSYHERFPTRHYQEAKTAGT